MLRVRNLAISFEDNQVLKDFNLDLESGDIFALLGDSGSGKSCALRFIAGLDDAQNGSVSLDASALSDHGEHQVKPEARKIGMVFQDYSLFPHMNVFNNICFGIDDFSNGEFSSESFLSSESFSESFFSASFSESFPSYPIPEITTFFGGFNYGVVTYDDNIAIGLENFLGKNSKYYQLLGNPEYLRFQKQKKFIASNVMEVWLNEHFQQYLGGRDLLSQLIYKGKIMYCIDKMLPELLMEDKFRFTNEQMNWVVENEASIWQYIVHEDLLFSKDEQQFRTFVDYAPFAKGMPPQAPGRVAYYIGYKMVNEYMDNNEIDVEELMYLTDSRKFLQQSKYKPTK